MPPTLSEAPEEVQVAFFIYGLLPDRYDFNVGYYLGKDLAPLEAFYNIYEVEDYQLMTLFISKIQEFSSKIVNQDLERRRKAEMRKFNATK